MVTGDWLLVNRSLIGAPTIHHSLITIHIFVKRAQEDSNLRPSD